MVRKVKACMIYRILQLNYMYFIFKGTVNLLYRNYILMNNLKLYIIL